MRRIWIVIAVCVLIISACAPSAPSGDAINTAIAQTQTAQPTPTLIPFSALDLESILIQENDLPAGYSGAQVSNDPPGYFKGDNIPNTDYIIRQQLENNNEAAGFITVLVYDDLATLEDAYGKFLIDSKPVTDLGEKAKTASDSLISIGVDFKFAEVVVVQCHAVVDVVMEGTDNEQLAIAYAERLVKRLAPLVCR